MRLRGIHGETMSVAIFVDGSSFEIADPEAPSALSVVLTNDQTLRLRDALNDRYPQATTDPKETP